MKKIFVLNLMLCLFLTACTNKETIKEIQNPPSQTAEQKETIKKQKIEKENSEDIKFLNSQMQYSKVDFFDKARRIYTEKYFKNKEIIVLENPDSKDSPEYSNGIKYDSPLAKDEKIDDSQCDQIEKRENGIKYCQGFYKDIGYELDSNHKIKSYWVGNIFFSETTKEIPLVYLYIEEWSMDTYSEILKTFPFKQKIFREKNDYIGEIDYNVEQFTANIRPDNYIIFNKHNYQLNQIFHEYVSCIEGVAQGTYIFDQLFNECYSSEIIGSVNGQTIYKRILSVPTSIIKNYRANLKKIPPSYKGCNFSCIDYDDYLIIKGKDGVAYTYLPMEQTFKNWEIYSDEHLNISFRYPYVTNMKISTHEYDLTKQGKKGKKYDISISDRDEENPRPGSFGMGISASSPDLNPYDLDSEGCCHFFSTPTLDLSKSDKELTTEIEKKFELIVKLERIKVGDRDALKFIKRDYYVVDWLTPTIIIPLPNSPYGNLVISGETIYEFEQDYHPTKEQINDSLNSIFKNLIDKQKLYLEIFDKIVTSIKFDANYYKYNF